MLAIALPSVLSEKHPIDVAAAKVRPLAIRADSEHMTALPSASSEKRNELVSAAKELLHEQGIHRTTIARVAGRADVPLGNVYYYFRTKDALAAAVLEAHETALRASFASWEKAHGEPRARLRCLVRAPLSAADRMVEYGSPLGNLWAEFAKLGTSPPLARAANRLLVLCVDWVAEQFRADGIGPRRSRELAMDLIGAIEGTVLLASSMRSKVLLTRQLRRVECWLTEPPSTARAAGSRLDQLIRTSARRHTGRTKEKQYG